MIKRFFAGVFRSPFKPLYDEARLLPEIRRSLLFILFGNIFGNLCGVITTTGGTALTGYAQELGANDFVFGVLTGIPLAATLLQIPFASLVSRTQKRKRYLLTYGVFSRALWIVVGLVPYFVPMNPTWLRLWSVIFLVGISSFFGSFINVCFTPWLADILPIRIRGRWMSLRDGFNSIAGVTIGLFTAFLLDTVPGFSGYSVVFLLGGIFGMLDMLCFIFVKEVYSQPPVTVKIIPTIKKILQDKPFLRLALFWTAWNFTANISGPYLNRYALGEMGLSFTQVTLCSQIASALITVFVISKWGRLLDHYGSKPILMVSCIIASLTPAFFLFAVPGNVLPVLLHNVIGAAFWSASNLTVTSMQLSHSPDDLRPSYIAAFSCITSLFGAFLGTLAGGAMIEGIRELANVTGATLFGMAPDPYKITFLVSVITRFIIVVYYVPRMENDKGFTVRQMVQDMVNNWRQNRNIRKSRRV